MTHAVVLMTALVPTTGHVDLINFAASVTDYVTVVVSIRSFEPTTAWSRYNSLYHDVGSRYSDSISFRVHEDDDAPQNSDGSQEFWYYWGNIVDDCSNSKGPVTHVVASEEYGREMAEFLGLEFIPYDIERRINPVKGTDVRKNLDRSWDMVTPSFRKNLSKNYVLMGQESVGKTTLTNLLEEEIRLDLTFSVGSYPEFARPYIEHAHYSENQVDTLIVTEDMMHVVEKGQKYMDFDARFSGRNQINIQDTDLISTEAYYRIFNSRHEEKIHPSEEGFVNFVLSNNQRTTYFILPDDIPVEEDPLRAAGTKRESTYQFWVDLAEEYGVMYIEVPEGTLHEKLMFMRNLIYQDMYQLYDPIMKFERE